MKHVLRALGAIWLLPVAVPIWLFFILPAWALHLLSLHDESKSFTAVFAVEHRWRWWSRLWARGDWTGLALPFCVLLNAMHLPPDQRRANFKHELRHCDQWLVLGPLFPIVYLVLLLWKGYDAHPLEKDAVEAEQAAPREEGA